MVVESFGYVRVSGKGQVKGHGPRRQRELIREFADANGYELVAVYEDAHTGTESDRPQFVAMLERMMGNGVKTVVVESLDRFARDLLIQSTLLAKLAAEGLTLIAANTGEDVTAAMQDDPMRKAMVQIQGVFAELDKNLTVRKLRKARDAAREKTGRCEGRKAFGHYLGEQAVLDRLRQLRRKPRGRERLPLAKAAETLNAEGFRNRTGGQWTAAHVRKIARAQDG
ncbi:MAG: recombinase family protein [Planctomycetaceae bacterium]|nr:recombinase family protein [Planctomycetaceae bacterium]